MLVFDIETTGLLHTMDRVHCINLIDRSTGKSYAFNGGVYADGSPAPRDGTIEEGLQMLADAECIAGQNIIAFDIPALKKVYPWWSPKGRVFDTKVCSTVIWTNLADLDFAAIAQGRLPADFQTKGLVGSHSLEAWGFRLGEYKGDFKGPWEDFTAEMDKYGRQDPVVTLKLVEKIEAKQYSQECLDLEHRVAEIIFRQQERGFCFDVSAAEALTATLQRRSAEIAAELQRVFPPWFCADSLKGTPVFVPKKDNKKQGYVAGMPFSRIKEVVFNPASRDHIADRLIALRGWKPSQFTDGGKPQVDESVLAALPWPEAKLLAEYLMVEKRLGQIATGKEAWLKHATTAGMYGTATGPHRIHGRVNTNGAVTGRMTHGNPNVAQTPAVGAPYGAECRACWTASPGLMLVGCDAEGLELRCLAHYMARWDEGAYGETVVNGKKELGTDVHTVNQKAAGLNTRDAAKTFIYALIYGAGDFKLGTVVYGDFTDEQRQKFLAKYKAKSMREAAIKRIGTERRARIMANLPALGSLVEAVKHSVKTKGHLRGLDGRLLHVRAEHAALNTLLQSAGAVAMKKALVLFDEYVAATYRSVDGVIVEPVANIHDEIQVETTPEVADEIGKLAAQCIHEAAKHFGFRCPLAGSYSVGANWRDTH